MLLISHPWLIKSKGSGGADRHLVLTTGDRVDHAAS